ncbi:MAG: hypothetical protein AAFP97_09455, partial [Pseudomonadota bacterium]
MRTSSLDSDNHALCLELLKADTEAEIISILKERGFWDDHTKWRPLGDDNENYSSAGNQQSKPEQAIIEKLVNAIDPTLAAACAMAVINPKSN